MAVRTLLGPLRQSDDPGLTRPAGIQSLQNAVLRMQEKARQDDLPRVITTSDMRETVPNLDMRTEFGGKSVTVLSALDSRRRGMANRQLFLWPTGGRVRTLVYCHCVVVSFYGMRYRLFHYPM